MTARRQQAQIHRAQRNAVLACALAIGEEGGAQALTMRAIAKRLDVNQALLYVHFKDKSALTRELTRIAAARLDAWLAIGVAKHVALDERLFELCLALVDFAQVHPWLYQLAFEDAQHVIGTRDEWQDHAFVLRATVLLADGVEAGGGDPVLLARQLCVAIHGLATTLDACASEPMFIERYLRAIIDGLTAGACTLPHAARLPPALRMIP